MHFFVCGFLRSMSRAQRLLVKKYLKIELYYVIESLNNAMSLRATILGESERAKDCIIGEEANNFDSI